MGPESFVEVKPAVRLDRRFRSLSVAGSGEICRMSVGSGGPCFRGAKFCTTHSVMEANECC